VPASTSGTAKFYRRDGIEACSQAGDSGSSYPDYRARSRQCYACHWPMNQQELKIDNPDDSTCSQTLKIDTGLVIGLGVLIVILLVIILAWVVDNDTHFLEKISLRLAPMRF
jgi:hypothetical protein